MKKLLCFGVVVFGFYFVAPSVRMYRVSQNYVTTLMVESIYS
jgi:hypothetical protein